MKTAVLACVVVAAQGLLVRGGRSLDSEEVAEAPCGSVVRVDDDDGARCRVAFDDGAASLDDLRAESGADELFADEACTQPAVQEDLNHGAIVYARHNTEAMADEEGG